MWKKSIHGQGNLGEARRVVGIIRPDMHRRIGRLALGILGVVAGSIGWSQSVGLYVEREPSSADVNKYYTGAKHEPKVGCLLGAFIDLDQSITNTYKDQTGRVRRFPDQFEQQTGKSHNMYFFYLGYGSALPIDWVTMLAMRGHSVHIALEPNNGLEYVRDDEYLNKLAKDMAMTGAKIFVRFASEMNGPWVNYHGNPTQYKEKFQLVTRVMRKHAPNVAMVWCPYSMPQAQIDRYYPGDAHVDWVGVNMYNVTYYNQDRKTPAHRVHPLDLLDYIYKKYSPRKPIMIGEYGTTHYSALEKAYVVPFAQRNILGLYQALEREYKRVKAINYFNTNNLTLDHRMNNNYAVTHNESVLRSYRMAISSPYFIGASDGSAMEFAGNFFGFEPVLIPAVEPTPPSALAFPLKNGDRVSGEVNLSGWVRTVENNVEMRFFVNNRALYRGLGKENWRVSVDASRLPKGKVEFRVEAYSGSKRLGRTAVTAYVE